MHRVSPTSHHPQLQAANRRDAISKLRIVVLGYVVRGPIGGMAWHHLHYVLGLHQLGHDVLFLEDSDDYPSCYDPSTHQTGINPSYGLRFAKHAFDRLNLSDRWAYFDAHAEGWLGPMANRAIEFCENADVLINVSGVNPLRSWFGDVPLRVFIDTDPLFTQVRHITDATARKRAMQHNVFFSFGELISSGESIVPDDGISWQPTRQPVVIDAWQNTEPPNGGAYSTVMQWTSYQPVEFAGRRFAMKNESFEMVRGLPNQVDVPLEIALGGDRAPRDELQQLGWRIVDPLAVTRDPWTYQNYLQHSRGEFSVAKQGYVATHCGWFSERTACYLASGRPAVVQETGFSSIFPVGHGIWAFNDAVSALEAIRQVEANYQSQCRAAREFALEYFDSRKVLEFLLQRVLNTKEAPPARKPISIAW